MRNYNSSSKVEQFYNQLYNEKNHLLVVDNYVELGKVTALRFLEWVQLNPDGVISLPTGKTPEFFIYWTKYFLDHWETEEVISQIGLSGIKPDLSRITFFQMDEFFPISPENKKSFQYFINEYYVKGFGLNPKNVHTLETNHIPSIDNLEKELGPVYSLRKPTLFERIFNNNERKFWKVLKYFEKYCTSYEKAIEEAGGIGFFLGGIGPDGHIAFNISGSEETSITRLLKLNYPSEAAAASDLGGMSKVREKAVITIGLKTITSNQTATAIIIAAGESKAEVIKDAIKSELFNSRFPSTVLKKLNGYRYYVTNSSTKYLKPKPAFPSKQQINAALGNKLPSGKKILHTSPHHDDIELAYFPMISDLTKNNNKNYFAYATLGYTSVTTRYIDELLRKDVTLADTTYEDDVYDYLYDDFDSYYISRRLYRKMQEHKEDWDKNKLKGWLREFESECMAMYSGVFPSQVSHLELPFYSDDIFPRYPEEEDIKPISDLLGEIKPDIITVALDPEGAGPDTHFKTLIAISEALKTYNNPKLKIWGYRNVWSQFDMAEANRMYQVKLDKRESFTQTFIECYRSQASAEFPSYKSTKCFPEIALENWKSQLSDVKAVFGNDITAKDTCGLIYLKEMTLDEFSKEIEYIGRVLKEKAKVQ